MPTTTTTPTTARALLAALAPSGPAAEGEELAFAADPPPEFDAALRVLHTGVRAQLAGRRWVGCDGSTGRVAPLTPAAPIPAGVTLLCVEGDARWDRIDPSARLDLPSAVRPRAGSFQPRGDAPTAAGTLVTGDTLACASTPPRYAAPTPAPAGYTPPTTRRKRP